MTTSELAVYAEDELMVMVFAMEKCPWSCPEEEDQRKTCIHAIFSELQLREYRRLGYTDCVRDMN